VNVLTVSEITAYLRETLEADEVLCDLWVRGEVSNFVRSQAGHLYFTLKDAGSQLRCVIFRGQLPYLACRPENGAAILAHGRVSVYEPSGQVQLYVDEVEAEGVGLLHLRFEELRRRLEREGLFDPARKRPLPRFPKRIGVVTSLTAAALQDILHVLARRFPAVEVLVSPTLVQGESAAANIAAAIAAVNEVPDVDLVIVARGGGSLEELWPFNEEAVARAIFASRAPVISGVGHETDVTIADLVADARAPTPTAAATLAVPDRLDYLGQVAALERQAAAATKAAIDGARLRLQAERAALARLVPPPSVLRARQRLDELDGRASSAVGHALALERERLRAGRLQLAALSPGSVLARGYSVCLHLGTGKPIKAVAQVTAGDGVQVYVADGFFTAAVQ